MSSEPAKTKNDRAWEELFQRYRILDQVNRSGQFVISSTQINEVRESRLMAKFDQAANLPHIFRDNQLSILPITRSQYVIGPFMTHMPLSYDDTAVETVQLPSNLESINYTNLYSEAAALNCAFLAGIITDLVGEETFHTVSGRMSTEAFTFTIQSTDVARPAYSLAVDGSQCEIDAGYEGANQFVLVEAKNFAVDDFLVRQLYYPYRLWRSKLSKRVVPVLMTFSNDVFSFFVYEFTDESAYNSLRLLRQRHYTVAPEDITRDDVNLLFAKVRLVPETVGVPFPQADSFDRVIDLVTALYDQVTLTRDEITANYAFDARQTNYYTDAARYLGLVEKYNDPDGEVTFRLTNEARALMKQRHKIRYLGFIRKILEHAAFYRAFKESTERGGIPDTETVKDFITDSRTDLNETTSKRRASTVRGWVKWIWDCMAD